MLFLGRDKLCADVVFSGEVRWKKTWGELGGTPVKELLQGSGGGFERCARADI